MQPCCCWTSTLWPCSCWTTCNAALLPLDFSAVALLQLDHHDATLLLRDFNTVASLSWTLLDFTSCAAAAVTQPCMPHT
jgi:hypothetical protein